jgi:hypothetical protein
MSSISLTKPLSALDILKLQRVLADAGYDAGIIISNEVPPSVAAKLLIRLFRQGVTSSAKLAEALEKYFGKDNEIRVPDLPRLHRYAIQGLPDELRGAIH